MHYLSLVTIDLPQLSLKLSKSIFEASVLYFRFLSFLFQKKFKKDTIGVPFFFETTYGSMNIMLFEGSPDVAALKEIFLDGEYDWEGIPNPKVIVDLGAHIGNTALYFHLKYPQATVYAVEASPKNYAHLIENTKDIISIRPIFGAVTDIDGMIRFYESPSSLGSSVVHREDASHAVEVPCFTLSTLYSRLGLNIVDYMKIDIEGSEGYLFKDMPPETFSRSYSIEVHDDLMPVSREKFVDAFRHYEIIFQKTHNPQRVLLHAKKR